MKNRIIHNEKYCKPAEFTAEQLIEIEAFKKEQEKIRLEEQEIEKEKQKKLLEEYAKNPNFGLGDAVAKVAQPIAKVIDYTIGTNIQECDACKKRQEKLNLIIPNINILK